MTLLLLAAMAFVAGGLVLLTAADTSVGDRLIGILSIGFFGFAALILGRMVLDRRPVLIVDHTGFWDRRVSSHPLPWQSIAHVTPSHLLGLTCFTVTLNQPVGSFAQSWESRFRRVLGWPLFASEPYDLDCTIFGLDVSRAHLQAAFDQAAPLFNGLG